MSRSYQTYKSRMMTHQRLASRNSAWNFSLIAFSTATTFSSIGMLTHQKMYGAGGETLMVILAVLALVASLVVANMNYSGRSQAMEANYKRIQQISVHAESFFVDS